MWDHQGTLEPDAGLVDFSRCLLLPLHAQKSRWYPTHEDCCTYRRKASVSTGLEVASLGCLTLSEPTGDGAIFRSLYIEWPCC